MKVLRRRRIRIHCNIPWLILLPVLWPRSSTKWDYASSCKSKELLWFIPVKEDLDIGDSDCMYLQRTLHTDRNSLEWRLTKIGIKKNLTVYRTLLGTKKSAIQAAKPQLTKLLCSHARLKSVNQVHLQNWQWTASVQSVCSSSLPVSRKRKWLTREGDLKHRSKGMLYYVTCVAIQFSRYLRLAETLTGLQ